MRTKTCALQVLARQVLSKTCALSAECGLAKLVHSSAMLSAALHCVWYCLLQPKDSNLSALSATSSHGKIVTKMYSIFDSFHKDSVCLSLSSPMNSKLRFASQCLVMAHSNYIPHLLCAPVTLFVCAVHPALCVCASVSFSQLSINSSAPLRLAAIPLSIDFSAPQAGGYSCWRLCIDVSIDATTALTYRSTADNRNTTQTHRYTHTFSLSLSLSLALSLSVCHTL